MVSLWYLLLTSLLTIAQGWIERRFSPDRDPVRRRVRSAHGPSMTLRRGTREGGESNA